MVTTAAPRLVHPIKANPRSASLWWAQLALQLATNVGMVYLLARSTPWLPERGDEAVLYLGLIALLAAVSRWGQKLLGIPLNFHTPGYMGTFAVSEEKKLPSIVPDVVRDVVCALAFMVSFFIFNPHNGTFYAVAKAVAILIAAWFIWRMMVQAYKRKYYLSYGRWAQTLIAPIIYSMVVASGLQYFSVMDEQVPAQPGIASGLVACVAFFIAVLGMVRVLFGGRASGRGM